MDISGPSSECTNKFIVPPDASSNREEAEAVEAEDVTGTSSSSKNKQSTRRLNVDPDYLENKGSDDSSDELERPAPVGLPMRTKRAEDVAEKQQQGVKMSIGNCEEETEETEEEQRRRFVDGIRNIRNYKREESFDLEEAETMREFINQQVNNAMLFNAENRIELDAVVVGKRKGAKIIEGYLWGAVIGVGSYGKVKEVIDTYTLTRRAAKIMKYDKLRKITNGWENIRSEMAILRRLNHRNVIRMIEVFNIPSKGKVYMIFEYCIGSVQQLLDLEPARRLTVGESHKIFVELCHGLNYLHAKRVAHKDIKPGNLLVSIEFTVKICDFGVAEQISIYQADGKCTKVNGTPKFQPPECVYGNHNFFDGYKADMWSAGVTLYNLVSGKYPFERPVLLKLYECIGTEPLVMPTNVHLSHDLQDLLRQLLEKDFTKRPGVLETMVHPWFMCSHPEDQGLGRIMERMRTGDRPLTMLPSMAAMYDGADEEFETDDDGNEIPLMPRLVDGGEIDHDTFRGFKFLEASPGDGLLDADEDSSMEPARRPSSRSMPTSAPPVPQQQQSPARGAAAAAAPDAASTGAAGAAPEPKRARRRRRNFFSCIFRSRADSA